jgi:hypothetical protein
MTEAEADKAMRIVGDNWSSMPSKGRPYAVLFSLS